MWTMQYTTPLLLLLLAAGSSLGCQDTASCERYRSGKVFYCKQAWTRTNCPLMCNTCSKGGTTNTKPPLVPKRCQDIASCERYRSGKDFYCKQAWTRSNCPLMCNMCSKGGKSNNGTVPPTRNIPNTITPQGNCGVPSVSTGRIIDGDHSKLGQWPWQVALYVSGKFYCGGSIISPEWVVTAAHCVYRMHPSSFKVIAGHINIFNHESREQIREVSQIVIHQGYKENVLQHDIALMKLKTPLMLEKNIKPVCLPRDGKKPKAGENCYISGWGREHFRSGSSEYLKHAQIKVISQSNCIKRNTRTGRITDQMICVGDNNFKGACMGDSGGPLVCKQPAGNWVLHGVVSWGSRQCNVYEAYPVFSRVTEYLSWIDDIVKRY